MGELTRDRLARAVVVVAATIEQMAARANAAVATTDGAREGATPEAAMLRRIVDVFAVYELDVICGCTRTAMAAKRERGERVSRFAPYGSELDQGGDLQPAAAELAALRLAGELAAAGVPLRRIGAELERASHRPRVALDDGRTPRAASCP